MDQLSEFSFSTVQIVSLRLLSLNSSFCKSQFGDPRLTAITVDGREITTFDEYVFEYNVYMPSQIDKMPEVSGTALGNGAVTKTNTVIFYLVRRGTRNRRHL